MLNKSKKSLIVFLLFLCCSGAAQAQFEVKRVKCVDLTTAAGGPHEVFYSYAGPSKITLQVVKDGCRPTKDGGYFRLGRRSSSGGALVPMARNGKQTIAMSMSIPLLGYALLEFNSFGGVKVSGFVDYKFTVEQD